MDVSMCQEDPSSDSERRPLHVVRPWACHLRSEEESPLLHTGGVCVCGLPSSHKSYSGRSETDMHIRSSQREWVPLEALFLPPCVGFIPQIFIEHLLYTRHFLGPGATAGNKADKTPSFQGEKRNSK